VIGEPRLHQPSCESTQDLLFGRGLPEGAVATTDHQTGGRGRLGRTWVAEPGTALLVSVLLRPPVDRRAPELSLVAAVAAALAVEQATELAAQIKWPNDIMLDRHKVAGILAELRGGEVVVGIGLNVNQTRAQLPDDARTPAASLRTVTGREHDREAVLADLLARLDEAYASWLAGGLDALYHELGPRDFLRGRRIRHEGVEATGVMVDRAGRLLLDVAGGERQAVESGEVELL
jgi:BirA family transcriptional regulator, biotin operon repressor / biotin---[acetyl-CoA-carboxylase] ligase